MPFQPQLNLTICSCPTGPKEPQNCWPSNLIETIKQVVSFKCPKPKRQEFQFELTEEAALKNFLVLKKYNFDLGAALKAQIKSPLGYGSEFKPPSVLEPLLRRHPNWAHLKKLLAEGSHWELEDLDEEKRLSDLRDALDFRNHKGAENDPDKLKKLVSKDVKHGYALPLPLDRIQTIPHVYIAPMNVAKQNTIDEFGNIIPKDRLTHDQSMKWGSNTSINSRVLPESLLPCPFGHALRRYFTHVIATRRKHPNCKIYASKLDYKSAFRRMHLSWMTALRSCTQLPEDGLALMALRLTFGGKPCPSEWGCLSETVCDLANAIMNDPSWDPTELFAPLSENCTPHRVELDDSIQIAGAKELVFDIPVNPNGYAEVFIDDTFSHAADVPGTDNILRLERGPLLALHSVSRPLDADEPIPRQEMAAEDKYKAEAGAEELKVILGWLVDHRQLLVSLPDNKFVAWTTALQEMIDNKMAKAKDLASSIGRMIHVAQILPEIYHFLNRLRSLSERAKNRRSIKVPDQVLDDCRLLIKFLHRANQGISMNNLVFQMPSRIYRSDSCPHGLGGYSCDGYAWRYYIPDELLYRASNNLLEHIASIITVWIDILAGRISSESCILSMTDSSTSEGWSKKTNFNIDPIDADCDFDPIEAEVRMEVCRHFATLCLDNKIRHYSQWFPGKENDVSDALSRDDDRSDNELTNLLYQFVPEQMPEHFEIVPLPKEIVSWLTSSLQKLPVKEQLREKRSRTKIGRGVDGAVMQVPSASPTISTLTPSAEDKESGSWEPLPWLSEKEGFRGSLMKPWLSQLSEVPFHLLHRPLGTTIGRTQLETKMASLDAFYLGYSKLLETKILRRNSRKQSQQ